MLGTLLRMALLSNAGHIHSAETVPGWVRNPDDILWQSNRTHGTKKTGQLDSFRPSYLEEVGKGCSSCTQDHIKKGKGLNFTDQGILLIKQLVRRLYKEHSKTSSSFLKCSVSHTFKKTYEAADLCLMQFLELLLQGIMTK